MQPTLEEYWEERHGLWWGACGKLGVQPADHSIYDQSPQGLDTYLTASGIRHFSGHEASRPWQDWHEPLVPPSFAWLGGVVLLAVADRFREQYNMPIRCRNWWRPPDYNAKARGATRSDHLWACGVDLDFLRGPWPSRVMRRRAAQKLVLGLLPKNMLSLGVGWATLHVGFAAPATLEAGTHRRWKYGKLPASELL